MGTLVQTWTRFREAIGLSVVVAVVFVFCAWAVLQAYDAATPDPFAPLEAQPVIVEAGPYVVGQTLRARDGVCNETEEPRSVGLYVYMQRYEVNGVGQQVIVGAPIDLFGTSEVPEEITVYHGCIATQPVDVPIPPRAFPGFYTLTVKATTESATGKIQTVVTASEPFEVVAHGD